MGEDEENEEKKKRRMAFLNNLDRDTPLIVLYVGRKQRNKDSILLL